MKPWQRIVSLLTIGALLATAGCGYFTSPEQRVAKAEKLIAAGEQRRALIELRNALQEKPELPNARLALAEVVLWLGDPAGAERELKRTAPEFEPARRDDLALRIDLAAGRSQDVIERIGTPADDAAPTLWVYRGQALLGTGEFAQAEAAFRAALARDPNHEAARAGLVESRAAQGDVKGAELLADDFVKDLPDSALASFIRGSLLARGSALTEAQAALEKAAQNAPRQLDVTRQVALMATLIEVQIANHELEKARGSAATLARIVPGSPLATLMSARVAMASGDYSTAGSDLRRIVNSAPQFARARFMLGVALAAQGNIEQASQELGVVVEQMPENLEARQLLAQLRLRLEDPAGAMRVLVPALDASADNHNANLIFEEARLKSEGDGRSLALLESEFKKAPDNRGLRLQLASAYLSARMPAKAAALLKGVSSDPVADRLQLAALAQTEGPAAANRELERMLSQRPGDPEVAVLAAQQKLTTGDAERAEMLLEEAVQKNPEHAGARLALARLQLLRGRRDAAVENLEILRRGDSRATDARLLLAQLALQRDDAKQADALIDEAVKGAPNVPETRNAAGSIYLATARYDAAREHFRAGTTLDPSNAVLWLNLGRAQLALEQVDAARDSLQRALSLRKDWLPAAGVLAFIDMQQGHSDAALTRIEELKRARPDEAGPWVLESEIRAAQRQFVEAEQAIAEAAKRAPSAALAVKAYQLRVLGERANPTEPLEQWVAKNPEDLAARTTLAEAQARIGAKQRAAQQYEQIIARRPRDVVALNNLAWLYFELKDKRATDFARRAHALAPNAAPVADTLGWVLVNTGQVEEGLAILEKVAAQAAGNGDMQYHYAAALAKAGRQADAQARLRALLDGTPRFASRAEAELLLASLGKGPDSGR